MDLALATGRGEALMTEWPGVDGPLVPDELVVQLGEREGNEPDWAWPDIRATAIRVLEVHEARMRGPDWVLAEIAQVLGRRPGLPFWIHFDVDVLDQQVMPAVDSPGSPGIEPDELRTIIGAMVRADNCAGMTVTIFDPDLDPDGRYAHLLVQLLGSVFC